MSEAATIILSTDSENLTTFEDTVNRLAPALAESKYSVWIYFKAGDLEIDTRKKDTNIFMSCNNRKNGSGQANSFSVCVAYVPNINSPDVNYIDVKLYGPNAKAGYQDTSNATGSYGNAAVLNECVLQYGYGNLNIASPRYVGQLLDYKVEIQNGMLMYTMTGYSGCVSEKENKHEFPQIGSMSYEEDGSNPTPQETERPTVVVKRAFEQYLPEYTVTIDSSALGKDKAIVIGSLQDKTVFEYAREVLALAEDESVTDSDDIAGKSVYYFTISDVENSKKITIKRTNPREDSQNAKANVIFDWMGGFGNNTNVHTGNLVQNFNTEFKGAIALNAMAKKSEGTEDEYSYSINSYGEVVKAKMFIGDPMSGDYIQSDASKNLSAWATATQYAYKATLTTVGLPCEIPIGEYIRVRPLIYGREHLTGGVYMITGSEDNVDNSGFTTTLSLVKIGT